MSGVPPWAVIFDVDGTMVNNRAYHEQAWIEYGRRHGFPITPEFYSRHIHSRSNERNVRMLYGEKADAALVAQADDEKEAIYRELFAPVLREMPGLTALLEALSRESVPCATVSNSPHPNIDFVLDGLNIRRYFAVSLSFTDVARCKPDPDLYIEAARRMGVRIERCVVIEDSPSGFAAAEAAGTPYVVITSGADPAHMHKANPRAPHHPDFTTITVPLLRALVR